MATAGYLYVYTYSGCNLPSYLNVYGGSSTTPTWTISNFQTRVDYKNYYVMMSDTFINLDVNDFSYTFECEGFLTGSVTYSGRLGAVTNMINLKNVDVTNRSLSVYLVPRQLYAWKNSNDQIVYTTVTPSVNEQLFDAFTLDNNGQSTINGLRWCNNSTKNCVSSYGSWGDPS